MASTPALPSAHPAAVSPPASPPAIPRVAAASGTAFRSVLGCYGADHATGPTTLPADQTIPTARLPQPPAEMKLAGAPASPAAANDKPATKTRHAAPVTGSAVTPDAASLPTVGLSALAVPEPAAGRSASSPSAADATTADGHDDRAGGARDESGTGELPAGLAAAAMGQPGPADLPTLPPAVTAGASGPGGVAASKATPAPAATHDAAGPAKVAHKAADATPGPAGTPAAPQAAVAASFGLSVAAPAAAPAAGAAQAAALQPPAAPPSGGAAADASASPMVPPATQVGQALASLHVGADGNSKLTIRLDPAELGGVQVQISRGQDGASTISVAVERLDTLRAMQADLTHLHLALDRAGIPEQRSLTLHLAPTQDSGTSARDTPSGTGFQGSGSGGPGGGSGQQGFSQGGRAPSGWGGTTGGGPLVFTAALAGSGETPSNAGRLRAGINITA